MKVKWLFFDIGSTLIDESAVYERRIGRIAELAGISKESASEKVLELYKQNKKGDLELARKYDVELPKWESEYEVPYGEAEDVLKKLHDKYKIGIIANQNPGTRERLEAWGLLKYIDMVVASAEEGVAKPDKRIFDIALERAGVAPEETFMIGDRVDNDILPAKNIGMKTIWVKQGFGGLWVIKNDSELPNFIAYNLSDVVSILDCFENSKSLLETTLNTRDLGDYKTRDGIELQKDMFIRSIRLVEVTEDEIPVLHDMQIKSFMPLYEKYHDDCSPAIESIERVRARYAVENRKYYFVMMDGARVGAINIGHNDPNEKKVSFISPLFILPEFQNRGIGYIAIQQAFDLLPEVTTWKLETILQEKGNCHLYEKCGFVRTGEEQVINENMTLIMYELQK